MTWVGFWTVTVVCFTIYNLFDRLLIYVENLMEYEKDLDERLEADKRAEISSERDQS